MAASSVNVPNSGGQLTGTVDICVNTFFVRIPPGSHITGSVTAVDLDATIAKPDTVTVTSVDNVTDAVKVTYSAGTIGHTSQITYDYQL